MVFKWLKLKMKLRCFEGRWEVFKIDGVFYISNHIILDKFQFFSIGGIWYADLKRSKLKLYFK
ncbi:hypothetical protein CN600_05030 [Bacillus mycoides]|nr:hypothetical protein CN600_05030 [Bacillus mycoides]